MRNNSDRIRPQVQQNDGPLEEINNKVEKNQELFSFAVPTELVELPSKGRLYPEGHPLFQKSKVEIRFMTAKDEDILTSKSLLRQGLAIDRLIESVVVDKRIKTKDLLPGDRNAILISSRISGYGADYQTNVTCPNCATVSKFNFDLESVKPSEEPDYDELGLTSTESGTYLVTLPKSNVEIEFKILSGKEESALLASIERQEKAGLPPTTTTNYLSSIIVSINGVSNRIQIENFISVMPSIDSRFLRRVQGAVTPNIDMKHHFLCSKCSHEQEVEIPITVDFFWSR